MELKKVIEDIKFNLNSEAIKNKIALDRGLKLNNQNKFISFNIKTHRRITFTMLKT